MSSMLQSTVGGLSLKSCIYNASGPRTGSVEALVKIGESSSGAVLSKSATLLKQDGNALPRFVNKIDMGNELCQGSMNSEGLPNLGIDYYISADAINQLSRFDKPYIISLSGLSLQDNLEMFDRAVKMDGVSAIELNLACPNVPGKPIIAYDFDQMEHILQQFTSHPLFASKPFGIKLAPYFDIPHYERATSIIAKYPVNFIVTCNTIGNGLVLDIHKESVAMAAKGGFGGLGGGYLKPIALANVRMLRTMLDGLGRVDIDIVGVGGVSSGKDAFELILCGAAAVQIGTRHWTEGAACFQRVAKELEDIMRSKGYNSIQEFKGKLKPYDNSKSNNAATLSSTKKMEASDTGTAPVSSLLLGLSTEKWLILESILLAILLSFLGNLYLQNKL